MSNDIEEHIRELIQCPVCLETPRKTPVRCCAAGHPVCESCVVDLILCPTCRGSLMDFNTNTVVGQLLSVVKHPCRFQVFGCPLKFSVHDLEEHEKKCQERTVQCGFREKSN